jgi:AcrR family transcriptional regulator
MPKKTVIKQEVKRRLPSQVRAQQKKELIFEATMRILHKHGMAGLTTNEIAAVSGVSIGTLYQYFSNKEDILAQLVQLERTTVMRRVLDVALEFPFSQETVPVLVREMLGTFGGRSRVYKELMDLAIAQGQFTDADPSYTGLSLILAAEAMANSKKPVHKDAPNAADNFVLTHAFLGAFRAYVRNKDQTLKRADVESALVKLVQRFTSG